MHAENVMQRPKYNLWKLLDRACEMGECDFSITVPERLGRFRPVRDDLVNGFAELSTLDSVYQDYLVVGIYEVDSKVNAIHHRSIAIFSLP